MTRKQDRYADKAANQARVNGETITAGRNVHELLELFRTHERPADHFRGVARHAKERRLNGVPLGLQHLWQRCRGSVNGLEVSALHRQIQEAVKLLAGDLTHS